MIVTDMHSLLIYDCLYSIYKVNNLIGDTLSSQHDKFQHFLFIANPNIPSFMSSTSDIIHIFNHFITLFFFFEVD